MEALRERFGKYHVIDKLAQGGMAEVYKVKTVGIAGFEKVQALKRILPRSAREARFIRSFIDEARIAAQLTHRNIVQVFDFGRADGELFMAMELIEGRDLRTAMAQAVARDVLPPIGVAAHVIGEVASGLDYAHRKTDGYGDALGIVHCDVSPSNVMLSTDGEVKILDFGIARASFASALERKRLRGKPRYMAPEQTLGEPPTAASDVFALGIIAWELVTGLPLFRGPDLRSILRAVRRSAPPPVAELNPAVPPELAAAIGRALAHAPDDRGTAADLGAACARIALASGAHGLAAWLAAIDGTPAPVVRPWHDDGTPPARMSTASLRNAALPEPAFGEVTEDELARGVPIEVPLGSGDAPAEASGSHDAPAEPAEAAEPADAPIDDDLGAIATGVLAERRRAVIVAAQLEGAPAGPDVARPLVRGLGELAYQRGGVALELAADGLVVAFGLEVAGEDDVAIAMAWALDACALARDAAGDAAELRLRIGARAGVATVAGDGPARVPAEAIADARALAREAAPDRPRFVGPAGRMTSSLFDLREVGAGRRVGRRSRAIEVVGPRAFGERERARLERRGTFIGRAAQLAELDGQLARAASEGRRRAVLVTGAAGAGKSRLVAELVARAAAGPTPPRLLAAAATSRHAPFALVIELYQAALGLPAARGRAARAQLASRVVHLMAARGGEATARQVAADLERAMELRDGASLAAPELADLRPRIAAGLAAFRTAMLDPERPLLTILEDLHEADAASLAVLRHALGVPAPGAELIVLTARPETAPPAADAVIELGDLVGKELRALIADRLGDAATPLHVAAVLARGGGNPLFVEELAAAVREAGDELPASARDVVAARVDRLSARAKLALRLAAVLGDRVRARLLEELLAGEAPQRAPGDDEGDSLDGGALDELVDAGLLVRASEAELAFARGLVREAVYDAMPLRARRDAHARLGRLLASRFLSGRDEPPATIAEHLELGGEPAGAAAFWLRAGRLALAAFDAPGAAAHFTRTLALERELGDLPPTPASRARRREAEAGLAEARKVG